MRSILLSLLLSLAACAQVDARRGQGQHKQKRTQQDTSSDVLHVAHLNATKTLEDRDINVGLGTCVRVGAGGRVGSLLGSSINVGAGACVCIDAAVDNLSVKARIEASGGAHLDVGLFGYTTAIASLGLLGAVDVCLQANVAVTLPPLISPSDPYSQHAFPPSGSCCLRSCISGYHAENGRCVPDTPTCPPGDVLCGTQCICTKDKVCVSGIPQTRKQRRNFLCPAGLVKCPVRGTGFECVDIRADIESCGGCLFDGLAGGNGTTSSGADCTALPDVDEVACVRGSCQIRSCQRGYESTKDGQGCILREQVVSAGKKIPGGYSGFSIQGSRSL